MMKAFLSVIIPAYNEESRIKPTIERIHAYLRENSRDFEIIVVDDGSSDGTASVVNLLSRKLGNINLIHNPTNSGKGYAVKAGVLSSQGNLMLTCDADLSTPIEELEKLVQYVNKGFDIAIGSRGLQESDIIVRQPWYRERMGKNVQYPRADAGHQGFQGYSMRVQTVQGRGCEKGLSKKSDKGIWF